MKKYFLLIFILFAVPYFAFADLSENLSGMILLQVEEKGEAWYVYPDDLNRYYLGRPDDAFEIMRNLGLGIKHSELSQYLDSTFPQRLLGKILIDVEENGEAYYIYPKDLKGYYLGRPSDAFQIMREKGLGITNLDLTKIKVYGEYEYASIEKRVFEVINDHRKSIGVSELEWSDDIMLPVREHSQNMASGKIELSHDGFQDRVSVIKSKIEDYNGGAENLAWNYSSDPAKQALTWWLTSPGHKASLENDFYDMTGVGVDRAVDGKYFITQFFINID